MPCRGAGSACCKPRPVAEQKSPDPSRAPACPSEGNPLSPAVEEIMAKDTYHGPLEPVDPCCWRIPKSYKPGMRVDGLIFANDKLLPSILKDQAPEQVVNVAHLPGIQVASLAMPD